MELGLASIILDCAVQATVMVNEHSKKKKVQRKDHLHGLLQQLDTESISAAVSDVSMASFMRGSVTAANVRPAITAPGFRSLITSLLLAVVTDYSADDTTTTLESMRVSLSHSLAGSASGPDIDHFTGEFTDALLSVANQYVLELRKNDPAAMSAVQQAGLLKRVTSVLDKIDRHAAAILSSVSSSNADTYSWLQDYRSICQQAHGFITPPDFETNRKIPMAELYVTPSVTAAGSRQYRGGSPLSFDEFEASIDRTVLLGDPGGGKSTLSNYLTTRWAEDSNGVVPFHVTLREYAKQSKELSIVQYIEQQLGTFYQKASPAGLVEDLLIAGQAVVVFDGLDELIDTSRRREVTTIVELFGVAYPLSKIFVTSRRVGYTQARLDPEIFTVAVVSEFQDEDVVEYVNKWFASQEDYSTEESSRLANAFVLQSEAVQDLRSNPLMLALMCIIFRGENFIPRNRPAVYEKCATLLFEKWDGHRDIEVALDARAHVDSAMKFIAHWMLSTGSGDLGVEYGVLVREMAKYLRERAFETDDEARRAAQQFVDFCKGRAWVFSDAGTTAEGEELFTFTHRTFMEYFAAFHLTRTSDTPEKLARTLLKQVAAEEWDVVAQLAIQIEEKSVDRGSERALAIMLRDPRKRTLAGRTNVLKFIARCALFSNVSPSFMRELTEACLSKAVEQNGSGTLELESLALGPWLELMRSVTDTHRGTVQDAHKSFLEELFSGEPSSATRAGTRLVLTGFTLAWQGKQIEHSTWRQWWELFRSVGLGAAKHVRELAEREPGNRHILVLLGLTTPVEFARSCRETKQSFGAMFYGQRSGDSRYVQVPSLSTAITLMAGAPRDESDQLLSSAFASSLARTFLEEMRKPEDSSTSFDQRQAELVFYGLAGRGFDKDIEPHLLEAAILAILGQAEITHAIYGTGLLVPTESVTQSLIEIRFNERNREEVSSIVDNLGLPDDSSAYLRAWAHDTVSIFDRVQVALP